MLVLFLAIVVELHRCTQTRASQHGQQRASAGNHQTEPPEALDASQSFYTVYKLLTMPLKFTYISPHTSSVHAPTYYLEGYHPYIDAHRRCIPSSLKREGCQVNAWDEHLRNTGSSPVFLQNSEISSKTRVKYPWYTRELRTSIYKHFPVETSNSLEFCMRVVSQPRGKGVVNSEDNIGSPKWESCKVLNM